MNIVALIIGILGLVAWLEPKIGFIVSYLAFFLGFCGYRKNSSRLALASVIIGLVGFAMSVVHLVLTVTVLR